MVGAEIRYVESQGYRIAYAVAGEGDVTVVYVPGFVTHIDWFLGDPTISAMIDRITGFARFVSYDKRGNGASDRVSPGEVPTLEERVVDLTAILDDLGADEVVLSGGSEGGPTSILYASLYPERVRGLVLYGTYARLEWDEFGWAGLAEGPEAVDQFLLEHWGTEAAAMYEVWMPERSKDPRVRKLMLAMQRAAASPATGVATLRAAREIDVRPLLPTVSVPTTVVHYRDDRAIPFWAAEEIAAAIPDCRLVPVDGADHAAPPWDLLADEAERLVTGSVSRVVEVTRVLTTVLFTDFVASTEHLVEVGDAAWRRILDQHDGEVGRIVGDRGGTVIKHTGDGVLARFDGPAAAIRAAHDLQRAVAALGIDLRAGVHTGEVELRGGDIGGVAVHVASRIADLAGAGEVLASRVVRDLTAGSGVTYESKGQHALKGVPDPVEILATTP